MTDGGVGELDTPFRPGLALLPVPGLKAQVHPFRPPWLVADAGFGVKALHGVYDDVFLLFGCGGGSAWSVAKRGEESNDPLQRHLLYLVLMT